ncbi:ATP-binding protein [Kordiimonas aquimaris]|uniref:ATP-binding protein n=1 Tax=Kordiimonas aquimaris TaxID=707591 RepID=UPI0021CEC402|nr:ATP-binding protein [Kordiimonas aquimaris]
MSSSEEIDLLNRKLSRENKARLEAEQLLEEKSAALYEANQALTAVNSGQQEYLTVLSDFALAITTIKSIDELAWYVVREVVGRLGFSDCVFYLYDASTKSIIQCAAIADKNPEGQKILNPLSISLGQGITGSVAASRRPEIVNDVSTDPRYVPDITPGGSEVCVPMLHDGILIGVIDCESPEKNFFSEQHLTALETVASYASAKVAERQAHDRATARTKDLEQKIVQLTKLKEELEAAKEKAEESSALKSRFVATISHEIRTPLSGILGSLDLLQDEEMPTKAGTLVEMARNSGQTLQALLNDVIDFARSEAGMLQIEPSAFSIIELVSSIQSFWLPHAKARNVALDIDVKDDIAKNYWGDPARIRQIINNYFSNALKYAKSARLILSVENVAMAGGDGTQVQFSIIDFGPGISAEDQEQLFSEFTRVGAHKRQIGDGAGLGLAICRQMAELMDGSVGVDSQPGSGSRFWLRLPIQSVLEQVDDRPATTRSLDSFRERLGARPRILVAEDVPTNQTIIRMTLEAFDCRVTIVNNGIEAVEATLNHDFDLIFMDIAMPEMDGMAATSRIHKLLGKEKAPPIYALTAHGMDTDREEFEAAGMVGIVTKPFDRQDLYTAIEQCLLHEKTGKEDTNIQGMYEFDEHSMLDRDMLMALLDPLDTDSRSMLLNQCIADLSSCLQLITDGFHQKDTKKVADATHKLKSVSGTFGLVQLQHLSGTASELGKQGVDAECLATAEVIVDRLPVGIEALRLLVDAPPVGEV